MQQYKTLIKSHFRHIECRQNSFKNALHHENMEIDIYHQRTRPLQHREANLLSAGLKCIEGRIVKKHFKYVELTETPSDKPMAWYFRYVRVFLYRNTRFNQV